jgi:hypothetical protein
VAATWSVGRVAKRGGRARGFGSSISTLKPTSSRERQPLRSTRTLVADSINKSQLPHPEPRRIRDREHVRFVAKQPCLICGRKPADPHHMRFTQQGALGRKVSDEFTVPLLPGGTIASSTGLATRRTGWKKAGINPTTAAGGLWLKTHPLPTELEAGITEG